MIKSGIYTITNLTTGKVYVVSANDVRQRFRSHRHRLSTGRHTNPHLQSSWNRYGSDAFSFDILDYCAPENLIDREAWWITLLRSRDRSYGYNLVDPIINPSKDPAVRAKLSIAATGRVLSDETRKKISAAHKGISLSAEHRQNISKGNKGRKMPPEFGAKISASRMGIVFSEEHKRNLSVAARNRRTKHGQIL